MKAVLNKRVRKGCGVILSATLAVLLAMTAADAAVSKKTISLRAGNADTLSLDKPVADLLIANPAVADVGTLRADRLFLVGKSIGDTNVLAFDAEGNQLADIAVRVRADEGSMKDAFHEFFPDERIAIRTVNDQVILSGRVSTPAVANQVRDLASRFVKQGQTIVDLMSVEGEQQVMLKVKVVEARRNVLREYGIETDYRVGKGNYINSGSRIGMTALSPFATGQIMIDRNGDLGPFQVALQGLERDGLVNTLAEPNLTAISGETAGFLAGGEFPVPTGRDQQGNVTLEFKQFGVSLNFTPTVLSSQRISLQLSTEVSAKSDDDAVTLVDTRVPGLTVRRAETTVQLGSGGTIMIAGLLKSDTLNSMNGVPGVQDLPIIGELFKSKSFARNESEVLILVTPYIVKPYAEAEAVQDMPSGKPKPTYSGVTPPPLPGSSPTAGELADEVAALAAQPQAVAPVEKPVALKQPAPAVKRNVTAAQQPAAVAQPPAKAPEKAAAKRAEKPVVAKRLAGGFIVD